MSKYIQIFVGGHEFLNILCNYLSNSFGSLSNSGCNPNNDKEI